MMAKGWEAGEGKGGRGEGRVGAASAFWVSTRYGFQPGSASSLMCGLRESLASLNITFIIYRMVVKISDHG